MELFHLSRMKDTLAAVDQFLQTIRDHFDSDAAKRLFRANRFSSGIAAGNLDRGRQLAYKLFLKSLDGGFANRFLQSRSPFSSPLAMFFRDQFNPFRNVSFQSRFEVLQGRQSDIFIAHGTKRIRNYL